MVLGLVPLLRDEMNSRITHPRKSRGRQKILLYIKIGFKELR